MKQTEPILKSDFRTLDSRPAVDATRVSVPSNGLPHPCGLRPNATRFRPESLPVDYLDAILRLAAQAPNECNPQPWRFIVVQEPGARERLRRSDAPVVLIAFTLRPVLRSNHEIRLESNGQNLSGRNGSHPDPGQGHNPGRVQDRAALSEWRKRQSGIALKTMTLVAEAYGVAAEPLEDYDTETVKRQFGMPAEAEVVALLALGFVEDPAEEEPSVDRSLNEIVHLERYGQPWIGEQENELC